MRRSRFLGDMRHYLTAPHFCSVWPKYWWRILHRSETLVKGILHRRDTLLHPCPSSCSHCDHQVAAGPLRRAGHRQGHLHVAPEVSAPRPTRFLSVGPREGSLVQAWTQNWKPQSRRVCGRWRLRSAAECLMKCGVWQKSAWPESVKANCNWFKEHSGEYPTCLGQAPAENEPH